MLASLAVLSRSFSSAPPRVLTGYRFAKPEGLLEVSIRHAKFRAVGPRASTTT